MNTLISILKNDQQHDIYDILEKNIEKVFLNPIGGWNEWNYDSDHFWQVFLHSRKFIPQFYKLSEENKYVEIGFSTIPFLKNCPDWTTIGITEHPLTWIPKAKQNNFHNMPGDGLSWIPQTVSDYAKLWCILTSKLENYCSHIYRMEDILKQPNILLKHFNIKQKNTHAYKSNALAKVTDDVWQILEKQASVVGYGRDNMIPDFAYQNKIHKINPTVSVIIAARNNSQYLEDAIFSAINQSIPPLEIIYVDDGSTDDSLKLASQFSDIKIIEQSHKGICEARNVGAGEASGDYLLYLDGDDIFPYRYIQNKLETHVLYPSASFIYSSSQAFGGIYNYYCDAPEWEPTNIWNSNFINTSTLIKKEHLLKVGGWRESIGAAEDWDLWIRMIKAGYHGAKDKTGFLLYRQHDKSRRNSDNTKTNIEEVCRLKFLTRYANCRITIVSKIDDGIFQDWLDSIMGNLEVLKSKLLSEKPYSSFGNVEYLKPNLSINYSGNIPSDIFNSVNSKTDDEIIWFINGTVPHNTLYESIKTMLCSDKPHYAVAGYHNKIESFQNIESLDEILNSKSSLMIFKPLATDLLQNIYIPSVSIVVPVWNEEPRLHQCLKAIQEQDFSDFEVIMVNDGSTDDSKSIMLGFAQTDIRFKYFENQTNQGTGYTVNYGFEKCKGKYLTWFSGDSWMYPTFISDLKNTLDKNPDKILAYSDWDEVDENGKNPVCISVPEYNKKLLQIYSYIGPCCLYTKEAKKLAGPFCTDICEDYYMYLMMSYVGDFIRVPKTLGCWRNHKNNLTNRVSIPTSWYKSSVVKAKARWSDAKYKIAYLCPTLDAANVGWWLMNVINDLSDKFSVRHILGDVTHLTIGADLRLYNEDDLNPEALAILAECDIVHINNAYPDFNQDVYKIIKDKSIVIHMHAGVHQWNLGRMKYWKEQKKVKVFTCTPGHSIARWIPNFMPVSKQKVPITYESYYTPEKRNNNKLKLLCHHNYMPGKGILQLRTAINDFDKYLMNGKLKDSMEWSICGGQICGCGKVNASEHDTYYILDHLQLKKQYDLVIDTVTHGYMGYAGWESMAQSSAVICRIDELTMKAYENFFGSIPPILNVRLIDDVINHIQVLITDKNIAKELGETNRKWILENYTAEIILDYYEKIYLELLT